MLRLPEKIDVFETCLAGGGAEVCIDPRVDGVVVPNELRWQAKLALVFGKCSPTPVLNLVVNKSGVSATLITFTGRGIRCVVPWEAVFAITGASGHHQMVWPASVPEEIRQEIQAEAERLSKSRRGKLRLVT